jgi:hypothetical protein
MSPIPRLPPVTTAVFPDKSNKSMISPMQNLSRASGSAGPEAYATTTITRSWQPAQATADGGHLSHEPGAG